MDTLVCSIIGTPDELEWPKSVSLECRSFSYCPQRPLDEVIPELGDGEPKDLLEVYSILASNLLA